MTIRTTLIASGLIAASLISGTAHAALQGRDLNGSAGSFEAYYDTDLNITWLANANVNGLMTWADANTWAANLSFTDGVNTYADWRLPTTLQPDASCEGQISGDSFGLNCTGSEMGYLFYNVLGNKAYAGERVGGGFNTGPFSNLQANYLQANYYWSGTEVPPNTGDAWAFNFLNGYQFAGFTPSGYYALAVSPGDVAAVPEAETYALMLAGLGLIGWRARRRG